MNRRIVPFSLVIAGSLLAYACSSSDDTGGTPTPGDEAGTSSGSSGTSGTSGSSGGTEGGTDGSSSGEAGPGGNPIDGVTTTAAAANFNNSPAVSTQGPIWGKDNNLYFSAVGEPSYLIQFKPSVPGDNTSQVITSTAGTFIVGNTYDTKTSRILTASATGGGGGAILATTLPSTTVPLTLNFGIDGGAAAFDSPQDLVARKDGLIFVTDGAQNDVNATGSNHIWRLRPTATANTYDALDFSVDGRPNGVALSADEKTLYVSFTNPQNAIPRVDKFTVATTDGVLSAQTKVSDIGTVDQTATSLGGIALDSAGNLYVASAAGVDVLKPDGTKWGHLTVPVAAGSIPTNVGFGGTDLKTLYVTTGAGLFTATVKVAGVAQ